MKLHIIYIPQFASTGSQMRDVLAYVHEHNPQPKPSHTQRMYMRV